MNKILSASLLSFLLLGLYPINSVADQFLRWGASITYIWVDDEGIKHFSSLKPIGVTNVEAKNTQYPIFSKEPGEWEYIGTYSSNIFSAKRAPTELKYATTIPRVWLKVDHSNPTDMTTMTLYSVKCATDQLTGLQLDIRSKGVVETHETNYTRYASPETSDEAVVKFACKDLGGRKSK